MFYKDARSLILGPADCGGLYENIALFGNEMFNKLSDDYIIH